MIELEVAVISAIVAVIVSYFTNKTNLNITTMQQEQIRQTARVEYMMGLAEKIVNARALFETFLTQAGDDETVKKDAELRKLYGNALGEAIAACYASGDEKLVNIAEKEFTPHFVSDYKNVNREAFKNAQRRMAQLIKELNAKDD